LGWRRYPWPARWTWSPAKARLVSSSSVGASVWRFDVTLRHADAGWQHYADNWEILKLDGTLLGRRVLLHPHDNEQPFTRSLGGVKIPAAIKKVRVRGHDKRHSYGGKQLVIVAHRLSPVKLSRFRAGFAPMLLTSALGPLINIHSFQWLNPISSFGINAACLICWETRRGPRKPINMTPENIARMEERSCVSRK